MSDFASFAKSVSGGIVIAFSFGVMSGMSALLDYLLFPIEMAFQAMVGAMDSLMSVSGAVGFPQTYLPVIAVATVYLTFKAVSGHLIYGPIGLVPFLERILGPSSKIDYEMDPVDRVKQRANVQDYIDGYMTEEGLEEQLEEAWAEEKGARTPDSEVLRELDGEGEPSMEVDWRTGKW